ncbi:MAG: DUF1489 domain-containing protein [Alphaproteobacteria bacterium]|nr:DUF1489 domain-containing protein [Alphaproteobacteria bacterium]MBV9539971.1 DUF1489 domain-containing protein [Alphaproteobacteria bacterium]MBV9903061.1 DUF1489 domain-containing protein [Alphaproteobacteria bacterium]
MTLHIIKLCVGVDTVEELATWQAGRIRDQKKRKVKAPELMHVTRMTPKRKDEILNGGSLYWVIKGQIAVRQRILDLRAVTKGGTPHCGIVYDPKLVPLQRRAHRAFQGWRYLEPKDAPPDARGGKGMANLPEELQRELVDLGLL